MGAMPPTVTGHRWRGPDVVRMVWGSVGRRLGAGFALVIVLTAIMGQRVGALLV